MQRTGSPWELGVFPIEILISLLAVWFITWLIEIKGVQKGIERANKFFIPLIWVLVIVLLARALTLPGALNGIDWYLKPDFGAILNLDVWLAAFGQIFYSLSPGMAIMIAYSSYLPKKSDIVNNTFIVTLANAAFSFLIGFAVFGTLGYMAHAKGVGIEEVVADSIGLAFVVFPEALSLLPGLKVATAVVFFVCIAVAGLSSLISLVEAFSSAIMDKFEISRKKAVNITVGIAFAGSLIYATRGGLYWLDIIDHFINVYGLLVVGVLEAVAIGWIFGADKIREWANEYSDIRAGKWWNFSIKILVPVVLSVLIIQETISNLQAPYGGDIMAAALGVVVMLGGMVLAAILTSVRKDVV